MVDTLNEQNDSYVDISGTSASNVPVNPAPSALQSGAQQRNEENNSRNNDTHTEGFRLHHQSHWTNIANMVSDLSMLVNLIAALLPSNGRDKNESGASKSDANDGASGSSTGFNCMQCRDLAGRPERQKRENRGNITVFKSALIELGARICQGVYLWRITEYSHHLQNARNNVARCLYSPPFYTDVYGYKLCLRINLNGVYTGYGSHVSLFVHMMQSDWDDTLEWPFSGTIRLSILDQSDDGNKRHISKQLINIPNLRSLERPRIPRNNRGNGLALFALIETIEDRRYTKNNCLLVRVEVSQ